MSEGTFNPLPDSEWVTSSSTQPRREQQQLQQLQPHVPTQHYPFQQQQQLQQQQQQQPHNLSQRRRPLQDVSSSSGTARSSRRPIYTSTYSTHQRTYEYDPTFQRHRTQHTHTQGVHSRFQDSRRSDTYSTRRAGVVSYDFSEPTLSRLERLPPGTGKPEGVWNAFNGHYTPQDWENWIHGQQRQEARRTGTPPGASGPRGTSIRITAGSEGRRRGSGERSSSMLLAPPFRMAEEAEPVATIATATATAAAAAAAAVMATISAATTAMTAGGGGGEEEETTHQIDRAREAKLVDFAIELSNQPTSSIVPAAYAVRKQEEAQDSQRQVEAKLLDLDFSSGNMREQEGDKQQVLPAAIADLLDIDFAMTPKTSQGTFPGDDHRDNNDGNTSSNSSHSSDSDRDDSSDEEEDPWIELDSKTILVEWGALDSVRAALESSNISWADLSELN
ncbi:hypothetical protein EDD11_001170 [Mortierella claussenii]|nr:hypothetical protein EDD11_001170 [Mortierella claussenii]